MFCVRGNSANFLTECTSIKPSIDFINARLLFSTNHSPEKYSGSICSIEKKGRFSKFQ